MLRQVKYTFLIQYLVASISIAHLSNCFRFTLQAIHSSQLLMHSAIPPLNCAPLKRISTIVSHAPLVEPTVFNLHRSIRLGIRTHIHIFLLQICQTGTTDGHQSCSKWCCTIIYPRNRKHTNIIVDIEIIHKVGLPVAVLPWLFFIVVQHSYFQFIFLYVCGKRDILQISVLLVSFNVS